MKKMKKIFAVMLSLAMVLGMAMTVSATEATGGTTPETKAKPLPTDAAQVEINNVEEDVQYDAYQIIDATYNTEGFTGYVWAPGVNYGEGESAIKAGDKVVDANKQITSDMITTLAKNVTGMTKVENFNPKTDKLEVGTWMIIVTPKENASKVYNPMIVSVYYSLEGNGQSNYMVNEPISAEDNWSLNGTEAYVKSSDVTIDKTITPKNEGDNNKGGSSAIHVDGIEDYIDFHIVADVPSYSTEYPADKILYRITDELSEGLTLVSSSIKVYYGNTTSNPLTAKTSEDDANGQYLLTSTERGFVIKVDGAYIQGKANDTAETRKIYVEYQAYLNEDAHINFDFNTNKATVEYSNKPGNDTDVEKEESRTYHYTFGIDSSISGQNSETTEEIFKIDGNEVKKTETQTLANPLAGATFSLTKTNEAYSTTEWTKTAISAADGRISFTGLPAGHYILKETEAPSGYSLSDKVYHVHISPTYFDDGRLKEYAIAITDTSDGKTATKTYTATEDNYQKNPTTGDMTFVNDGENTKVEIKGETVYISNTQLSGLPSTGGIGTTIFTIGGCAIMIIAAGLFFASRRKSTKDASK